MLSQAIKINVKEFHQNQVKIDQELQEQREQELKREQAENLLQDLAAAEVSKKEIDQRLFKK